MHELGEREREREIKNEREMNQEWEKNDIFGGNKKG